MTRPNLREHLKLLKEAAIAANRPSGILMHEAKFAMLAKCDGTALQEAVLASLFGGAALPLSVALKPAIESKKKNVQVFTETLSHCLARHGSATARSLAEHACDSHKADAIFETLRQLFAASSPEAAPALAVLLANQLTGSARLSIAFRGCARLFADLHHEEFPPFRRLIERLGSLDMAQSLPALQLTSFPRSIGAVARAEVRVSRPTAARPLRSAALESESIGVFPYVTRLFHLLKVHGLGHDAPVPGRSRALRHAASTIRIDFERIHLIRDCLGRSRLANAQCAE